LNTITCNWNTEEHLKNKSIALIQGVALAEHPTLRNHKMNIGLFDEKGALIEKLPVIMKDQAETVVNYTTDKKIAGIVPNIDDMTFIKINFDETSLNWIKGAIPHIEDPLTRQLSWRSLFEMVRDANKIKSTEFLEIAFKCMPHETNSVTAETVTRFIGGVLAGYVPEKHHANLNEQGFKMT